VPTCLRACMLSLGVHTCDEIGCNPRHWICPQSTTILSSYNSDLDDFAKAVCQPSKYLFFHAHTPTPTPLPPSHTCIASSPSAGSGAFMAVIMLALQGSEEARFDRGVSVRFVAIAFPSARPSCTVLTPTLRLLSYLLQFKHGFLCSAATSASVKATAPSEAADAVPSRPKTLADLTVRSARPAASEPQDGFVGFAPIAEPEITVPAQLAGTWQPRGAQDALR
jgi:hypothetical protein